MGRFGLLLRYPQTATLAIGRSPNRLDSRTRGRVNRAIRAVVLAIMLANGCGGGHAGLAPDGGGAGRDGSTGGASATGGASGSPGIDAAADKSGDARTTGGGGGSTGAGGGAGSGGTGSGGAGSGGTRDGGSLGAGGTSDASARDDGPRNSGGDGGCIAGCSTRTPSTFCAGGAVEWVCNGSSDLSPFTAACQMLASGAIRYCCPAAFLAQCQ